MDTWSCSKQGGSPGFSRILPEEWLDRHRTAFLDTNPYLTQNHSCRAIGYTAFLEDSGWLLRLKLGWVYSLVLLGLLRSCLKSLHSLEQQFNTFGGLLRLLENIVALV